MEIPESLRSYFDNKAVRRAVDELVEKLDGQDMPECDWEEAQNYNQALLMASQVRADYAALLFKVWEATFGRSDPQRLLGEYFAYDQLSPSQIWEDEWLWRSCYRDGDPDEGGRWDDLCVSMGEDNLELRVYRYNADGESNYSETPSVERWSTYTDDGEEVLCLTNENLTRAEFFSDPDAVVHRFAKDATIIVEMLLET